MESPRITPVPASPGLRRTAERRDGRPSGGGFERAFAEQQEDGCAEPDENPPTARPLQAKPAAGRRDRYAGDHRIDVVV